jgi:hypothetical protein
MYTATGDEIYITSFCGEHKEEYEKKNGLLSQWRGYGSDDGGCIVVFDTLSLEELLDSEIKNHNCRSAHISDVVYDNDEQKFTEEFTEHTRHLGEYLGELVKCRVYDSNLEQWEKVDASKALPSWINCITRFKHRGFKEENEIRIVVDAAFADEKTETGSTKLPDWKRKQRKRVLGGVETEATYIELLSAPDIKLPIKQIIIGPHKNKFERLEGMDSVPV